MGFKEGHRAFETNTVHCNISEFRGSTAIIDGTGMAFAKSFSTTGETEEDAAVIKFETSMTIKLNLLQKMDIKTIVVLDGRKLPAKLEEQERRRDQRAKENGTNYLLAKNNGDATIVRWVTALCDKFGVDVIVAPFEADPVMAWLSHSGYGDIIITEDCDMIGYGCEKVSFNPDSKYVKLRMIKFTK